MNICYKSLAAMFWDENVLVRSVLRPQPTQTRGREAPGASYGGTPTNGRTMLFEGRCRRGEKWYHPSIRLRWKLIRWHAHFPAFPAGFRCGVCFHVILHCLHGAVESEYKVKPLRVYPLYPRSGMGSYGIWYEAVW